MNVARYLIAMVCSLSGCVESKLLPCNQITCPLGTVCTPGGCATPADVTACDGKADGEHCATTAYELGACAALLRVAHALASARWTLRFDCHRVPGSASSSCSATSEIGQSRMTAIAITSYHNPDPTNESGYATRAIVAASDVVPLRVGGEDLGSVAVAELLP